MRGHPAVLKLDACAEALPRVHDEALAEKLSTTATLERLLAIEVDSALARRLAGRLRFACLPTPASLDDFDYDAQPGVERALMNELGTCGYLETAINVHALSVLGRTGEARAFAQDAVSAARAHGNPNIIAYALLGYARAHADTDPAHALNVSTTHSTTQTNTGWLWYVPSSHERPPTSKQPSANQSTS